MAHQATITGDAYAALFCNSKTIEINDARKWQVSYFFSAPLFSSWKAVTDIRGLHGKCLMNFKVLLQRGFRSKVKTPSIFEGFLVCPWSREVC
jgi:hypothetical protein